MPDEDPPKLERDEETVDLDRDEREEARRALRARAWWERRRVDPERRDEVLGSLFPERERTRPYLFRFSFLMTASMVIAVLGILADSSALVIGAMLLAPLMTPVLALAAGMLMVWPRRAGRAAILVLTASVGGVLLAWLAALVVPSAQTVVLPQELLSRTEPNLLDLVIALAAGAAGGYALVREELGTSLPGVAVAVSLVPPLAVVGATLELGRLDLAFGASLLYLTNLAAIVLAAGVAFVATGFVPTVRITRLTSRAMLAFALALLPVGLLSLPLAESLQQAVERGRTTARVSEEVQSWLGDHRLEVVAVEVEAEGVVVDVSGPDRPPPATDLARRLQARLERPLAVTVRWVERHDDVVGAAIQPPTGEGGLGATPPR